MEKDDRAGMDLPQDGPCQPPDPPIPEVAGPAAEGDALHAQLLQHPGQPGVGDPHGRPEKRRPDAEGGQHGPGCGRSRRPASPGNAASAGGRDGRSGCRSSWPRWRISRTSPGCRSAFCPVTKKAAVSPMPLEKVEQTGGHVGIGAVVEGQRHRFALPPAPADHGQEETRPGKEGRRKAEKEKQARGARRPDPAGQKRSPPERANAASPAICAGERAFLGASPRFISAAAPRGDRDGHGHASWSRSVPSFRRRPR